MSALRVTLVRSWAGRPERQRTTLEGLVAALRSVAPSDDVNAIEAAAKTLAEGTDEFAARRMDKSIRRALAGRKLDEI